MMHQFSPVILRKYDIRGIVGSTLHPDDAELLGRILAGYYTSSAAPYVLIGYDGRLSSPALYERLCHAFTDCGIDVVTIGQCATPELYFTAWKMQPLFAVMITGSHNPINYNGFKISRNNKPFWGEDIQQLAHAKPATPATIKGQIFSMQHREAYINYLVNTCNIANKHVVWDPANGALCPALHAIIPKLIGTHYVINGELDGRFPNHHPDPTQAANLVQLQEAVKKNNADIGIGFDGDGDRIGVVDSEGDILWGDQLLALYADILCQQYDAPVIIADVKASQVFFDHVLKRGGRPMMMPTGHSIIKSAMIEHKALLAGEMSGHIFFKDRYGGFDDALYAALRVLELLHDTSLKDLKESLPKTYASAEIRIDIDEARKFSIIDDVSTYLEQQHIKAERMDGIRVNQDGGWWLLRASNTESCLVMRAEGPSPEKRDALCQYVQGLLSRFQ